MKRLEHLEKMFEVTGGDFPRHARLLPFAHSLAYLSRQRKKLLEAAAKKHKEEHERAMAALANEFSAPIVKNNAAQNETARDNDLDDVEDTGESDEGEGDSSEDDSGDEEESENDEKQLKPSNTQAAESAKPSMVSSTPEDKNVQKAGEKNKEAPKAGEEEKEAPKPGVKEKEDPEKWKQSLRTS